MDFINDMLEFKQIINKLKENAVTDRAKERFDSLVPILSESLLRKCMQETTEGRKILDNLGTPPFSPVKDIKKLVDAAERGELLTIAELEQIKQFSTLCMRLKRYLKKSEEWDFAISSYSSGMMELDVLKDETERCIRNERIDDYASKELREIRRKLESITNQIRSKLDSILKSRKDCFSESFISNRNGHFTLPVKKEHKFQISGSVIDISSSGATYFIEPTAVSKLKEEYGELLISESNEERKVLYMLSANVSDFKHEILLNLHYIEELDYIFSKAKLSVELKAIEPVIHTKRHLRIINGRHPLLSRNVCVPLGIEVGDGIRGVVITGPNTGGKTVALKTVGLFSVMAQCGLHLPCDEAEICMNSKVICDIGDGQSITENLSTFSAHMKNVISIVKEVDSESLVLLDELGSGTDPAEGMGIAIAILEELRLSNCNFIATTHYPEVKGYAQEAEGMVNARMAFDKESLKPLYSLEMGQAGESCALYIAKRLGMSSKMLERAYQETYRNVSTKISTAYGNYTPDKAMDIAIHEENVENGDDAKILSSIQRIEPVVQVNRRAERFKIGDSVMVYPQKKIGIVFEKANSKGEVGVQIKREKLYVNHKRLQLKAAAEDLYPEDYDFSIVFDSADDRKARHTMERKHVPGLTIRSNKI